MDGQTVLENIVRVGTVSAVDAVKRKARVKYDDMEIVSGWLFIVQHPATEIHVEPDPDHDHPGTHLTYWMPKIDDRVLVLYLPVFNGDGFILGGL